MTCSGFALSSEKISGRSDITVETTLTEYQLAFFEPKVEPVRQVVEAKEKQPRPSAVPYQYRGDTWDDCRRLCEKLMPQSVAETAFQKARRLGGSPDKFTDEFQRVKGIHDQNVKSGKVGKGNFGKYLNACYDNRVAVIVEEERKERVEALMNSPEFQKRMADRFRAAEADPLNELFILTEEAVANRVRFDENPVTNYLAFGKIRRRLGNHLKDFIRPKNLDTQREVDLKSALDGRILRHALATLNGFYKQPVLATGADFERAIDGAIAKVVPTMKPLFTLS